MELLRECYGLRQKAMYALRTSAGLNIVLRKTVYRVVVLLLPPLSRL